MLHRTLTAQRQRDEHQLWLRPNGNQTNLVDALGRETDYVYDAANRLTVTQLPVMTGDLGRRTRRTVYDGLGRKTEEIDELGVNTDFTYDYRGLLLSVTLDARTTNAATTTYDYDESGQLTAQTDANGHATQFQYDALGRRTKRTLPHAEVERLAYDWAGNLILQTNFNGVVITNQYDVLSRLTNRASVKMPPETFSSE